MKLTALIVSCFLLSACVSQQASFRNSQGQEATCSASGWGWFRAPVAVVNFSECVRKAEARGYIKQTAKE